MMDFIMVPTILAIITLGIYKLFELFVCKKERLTIIEKMGEKFTPDMLEHKINFSSIGNFSFSALKLGCLLTGMGLGLLVGYVICAATINGYTGTVDIGVSPYPFLFAVTVAASMCFASPFSTPPNALVMSAGKYTFMDYVKVGLPLQVIMGIVMVLVLPLLFPF